MFVSSLKLASQSGLYQLEEYRSRRAFRVDVTGRANGAAGSDVGRTHHEPRSRLAELAGIPDPDQ